MIRIEESEKGRESALYSAAQTTPTKLTPGTQRIEKWSHPNADHKNVDWRREISGCAHPQLKVTSLGIPYI